MVARLSVMVIESVLELVKFAEVVVEAIAISFTADFLTIPLLLATFSCVL